MVESSVNIDYLLQNYAVQDVVQIQQKLKNDVEKKRNDLKLLIGERYNELFRATDSFETMNSSVNDLIYSLKCLNNTLKQDQKDSVQNDNSYNENHFYMATICRFLFDLPLQIWDFLHRENFVLATYSNFYGKYITDFLSNQYASVLQNELCFVRSKSIENLTFYIIENCWQKIKQQSTNNEIDYQKFADIFCCLLILNNWTLTRLIEEFLEKQTNNIQSPLIDENRISVLIETIINIIFNTIRCWKIFRCESPNQDSMFSKRLKYIVETNFLMDAVYNKTSHVTRLPNHLTGFIIQTRLIEGFDLGCQTENDFYKKSIENWITSTRDKFTIVVESKFKLVTSIKELYLEICAIEKKQQEDDLIIKDLSRDNQILDVKNSIWKQWFIDAFENRVYEITNEHLQSIIEQFVSSLSSIDQKLLHYNLNIVEFVWKDSSNTKNQNNNEFINLIIKSLEMIDLRMKSLYEDIIIFKDNYQHFLDKIYNNIYQFLFSVKSNIDTYKAIKPFLLFGAVLFQKMPNLCPSLSLIFSIKKKSDSKSNLEGIDWNKMENQIKTISEDYLMEWFTIIISDHFNKINPMSFIDLSEFLKNLSLWESVSLSSEDDSKCSMIEVPIQISLITFEVLQNICIDINRFCAHTIPRKVQLNILILVGRHLLQIYQKATKSLSNKDNIPKQSKQIISIQIYFDLFFLKKIFTNTKDEILRNEYLNQINELMSELEANIDPFDMHLIHPFIELNTDRLHKSYHITFGFLFLHRYQNTSLQSETIANGISNMTPAKEISHNLMLVHSCSDEFK